MTNKAYPRFGWLASFAMVAVVVIIGILATTHESWKVAILTEWISITVYAD